MAACTGRRRGQKRWESILFVSCFENPHLQGSGQVEPACVCADAGVEQSRPDKRREGWQERGLQHFQQVCHFSDEEINDVNKRILKVVLQTMWKVFPEGLWLVVPPLLLVPWSTVGSAPILQVLDPSLLLVLPKANLPKA